ncbi:MAG: bifunctional glutamate N-acetyltransferase/amino-acid acetyltransferase ArgJ [Actinomycetota bacterium]
MRWPRGFSSAAVRSGLKPSGTLDLGVLASDRPATLAGLSTSNLVKAAPVRVTQRVIDAGRARAVVVNAGNANACTGDRGIEVAEMMQAATADLLGCDPNEVAVASTGIIGVQMPTELVREGIAMTADATSSEVLPLARAIMTTDTRPKIAEAAVGSARIVGIAKGAGMIAPEMATMLCFIATDAQVGREDLDAALRSAASNSFEQISVDGCMSTNDTVLLLANGAAGPVDPEAFSAALSAVCASLADQIVSDGEGATKVIDIFVGGARDLAAARRCARSVADSVLFRCAMNGGDPNWGRILSALGASGADIDPDRIAVRIGGEDLCVGGERGPGDLAKAEAALKADRIRVDIDLGMGDQAAKVTTNDLSAEYVRINAEYTT